MKYDMKYGTLFTSLKHSIEQVYDGPRQNCGCQDSPALAISLVPALSVSLVPALSDSLVPALSVSLVPALSVSLVPALITLSLPSFIHASVSVRRTVSGLPRVHNEPEGGELGRSKTNETKCAVRRTNRMSRNARYKDKYLLPWFLPS